MLNRKYDGKDLIRAEHHAMDLARELETIRKEFRKVVKENNITISDEVKKLIRYRKPA